MNDAVREWMEAMGAENVAADDATRDRYARTTQDAGTRPLCVLYPRSTAEVQAAVRIAANHHIALYPISRGCNWGYGDACAPTHGAAILDLSRMNRIVEVNTELAYAIIEPGVTQQQLYECLRERKSGLWLDCTGAGRDASLVGNTLDRGFGHTRYGDHVLSTCGMEIVLADGQVLKTGFGHYEDARAAHIYRYGVGPSLDGLFCQSNLGIVTQIGIWLMPEPEAFCFFFIKLDRDTDLDELIDRLRPLRLQGVIASAVHIGNDLRILSASGRYPWAQSGGKTPLPDDIRARLAQEAGVGAWNAGGSLTGTAGHVRASIRALRKAMKGLARVVFVDDRKLALGGMAESALHVFGAGKKLGRQLQALRHNYGLLQGVPTDEPLLGAQWRLRKPPDGDVCDPLDAGCGLMWISPVVPMTGRDARAVLSIAEPLFDDFGFELLATFTLINERAMIAILNVAFDKSDAEETARATACYDATMDALIRAGYYPYRVGLRGLSKIQRADDVFWDVAAAVKHALDPHGIIAPGRYIPVQDP